MKILVTGGCGFIGSAVVRRLIADTDHHVINADVLTYASTMGSTAAVQDNERYSFEQVDICDRDRLDAVFAAHQPDSVIHLAAESHVDRSIDGPMAFVQTNLVGTATLLDVARAHGIERFVHVSTDEVFGDLAEDDPAFSESTPYRPHSPYSASKAGSDHLARAWHDTFDLPVMVTNCSNNYGPFHFPEKLIPLVTLRALAGEPLPVYGDGSNIRDWLYVDDHARALIAVLTSGQPGETYNIGGDEERTNLQVVEAIADTLDQLAGVHPAGPRRDLVHFVTDRPGHDRRYAIDATKIKSELGWHPTLSFDQGLRATVSWYLDNESWWKPLLQQDATVRRGAG